MFHSVETALLKVYNDCIQRRATMLHIVIAMLDISAAFDIADL